MTYHFAILRSSDVVTRKRYVNLVESVKASGGTVHIFSSMHVSGERKYSGFGFTFCSFISLIDKTFS